MTWLFRAELRKLTDTRTGKRPLIAVFATTPLVVAGMAILADPRDLTYSRFVDFTQTPEKLLLPILGLLVIATTFVSAAVGNLLGVALRHGDGS